MTATAPSSLWRRIGSVDVEFVLVPAGPFLMGTPPEDVDAVLRRYPTVQRDWILKEVPQHRRMLDSFYLARLPLSNASWSEFATASGGSPAPSTTAVGSNSLPDHPAWGFRFEELLALCAWIRKASGTGVRPPTEAEWEKAARGSDGREYPWGNRFDVSLCNTREAGHGATTAAGSFPLGAAPYGHLDMAGNVEEWTSDFYLPYPGGLAVVDDAGGPGVARISRGGSYRGLGDLARCARRHAHFEGARIGARLVLASA